MSFLDDIYRGYFPRQPTPEDFQKLLASFMGGEQASPASPITNQMQPFGPDAGATPAPRRLAPGDAEVLRNLPPDLGMKFIMDQLHQDNSPEQQQRTAALQSRQKIADEVGKIQNAPPDFAPVNISPQLVGEGVTGTRSIPNMPAPDTMPAVPTGLQGFDYGGKVTQPTISPELMRSLALQSFSTGGNPADITALMNIGRGEQFDLAKGAKRFDQSGNVIAANDAPNIEFVNGQAVNKDTGLPVPGAAPIPPQEQGPVSPERLKQLLDIAKARGTQAGNVQSVQQAADGSLIVVHRDGKIEHMALDGSSVKGTQTPEAVFNRSAAQSGGKAAGTAAEALPTTTANFDVINKTLDAFDEPAVKSQASAAVGYGGLLPTIPGVNSDFKARMDQLEGQAFLQAFNTLRGGGQITEVEGAKATAAIARLKKAQTPTEFYAAKEDAKKTFATLFDAAKTRANRGAVVPQLNGGGDPAPTVPPGGILRYDAQGKRIP